MFQDLASVDTVFLSVAPVVVDTLDDKCLLGWLEELAGLGWEIDDDKPAESADNDSDCTLNNEDPWWRE